MKKPITSSSSSSGKLVATTVLPYQTPRLRDHYIMGKKLGQGQFGTTYLCKKKSSGAHFAYKSIPKRKLLRRDDYDDVLREIQIMHHLSEHPKVVRIEGSYEEAEFVHLVMELCGGGELFDRIVKKGHYSEMEAVKLIRTIVGDGRIEYGDFAAMMRKVDGGTGRSRSMRNNLTCNLADAFGVKDST